MGNETVLYIKDHTNELSLDELEELKNFVFDSLHSTNTEIRWLGSIEIRNDGIAADYFGFWTVQTSEDTREIVAKIVLNRSLLPTLNALKTTLAHEYGHHWTLCYLLVNQGIEPFSQRLPWQYYELRGLNQDYAYDVKTCSERWNECDKEIIAEDYRVLFAPNPYNQNHEMNPALDLPNPEVKNYIQNLPYLRA
ncbi:MAG: hypothetical protein J7647_03885 [Cyanobacteria bacterium SBLK]|nr:hypothetical protein [Cyanobacteria bacterium SBLK]